MRTRRILPIILITCLLLSGCTSSTNDENLCGSPEPDSTIQSDITFEKPAIYVYGYPKKEKATVTLSYNGILTMSYPALSGNSWTVKCTSGNRLVANGQKCRYLFWEGISQTQWDFSQGFCVAGTNTISFLDKQLKKMGLDEYEIQDFITYWGPRMIASPYNIISFQTDTYEKTARLSVSPSPDCMIRVFMAWCPVAAPIQMKEQQFTMPTREGKVVVEWGGVQTDPAAVATAIQASSSAAIVQQTMAPQAGTAPAKTQSDPYAQYGAQAQCAKDWDATAAAKCGKTWAQLDAGTRSAAWNHWQGHGSSGW